MRSIRSHIWEDLSRGKNYALYVFICVGFILPFLNFFGLLSAEWLLRAPPIILALLVSSALYTSWQLQDLKERLHERKEQPLITIHTDWCGKVYEEVAAAKKSVVILTSWAIDSATLGDKIKHACEHPREDITVEIFMLDPDQPFGPQRYGEVFDPERQSPQDWKQEYRNQFETARKNFRRRLAGMARVHLTIYKYPTMPTLKMYVVDGERFFYSWLTADGGSTNNVCFELSALSNDPQVIFTKKKFNQHLAALRKQSTPV